MNHHLQAQWAVVTGASSGIGLEFAKQLAAKGMHIVLISNQLNELTTIANTLKTTYKVEAFPLCIDLTRADAPNDILAFLSSQWIEPYIFINNAGIFSFREIISTPALQINAFINLHIRSVTELSRLIAKKMDAQPNKGFILNMASMSCWMPMPGLALYSATKAYIRVFTRALALEMRPRGVKIMVCCPGGIATNLFGLSPTLQRLAVNLGVITTPKRFVKKALSKLLKGKMQYINGFLNRCCIFFISIQPTCIKMLVKKQLLDKGIYR